MAIKINLLPMPQGAKQYKSTPQIKPKGDFPDVQIWQFPFVQGDVMQMEGWLKGLGWDAMNGFIEIVLHEGLMTVNAELDVYNQRTRYNLDLILSWIQGRAVSLSSQFPKSHFRIKAVYNTEWVT